MPANTREIQRRIKSVGNTQKITKAMEMVAAAKMRRSVEAVLRTRTYANLSWLTVLNLAESSKMNGGEKHPLFEARDRVSRVGIILVTSNRGLCGNFNTAIINKAHDSVVKHQDSRQETHFIVMGKKGLAVNRYYGYHIAAEFPKADIASEVSEITPVSRMAIDDFLNGTYDKVMVAYTDFISAGRQLPRVKQLLPVDMSAQDEYLGIVGQDTRLGLDREFLEHKQDKYLHSDKFTYEYVFEPSPMDVLDEMIPRLVEVQLFQALLESNASEHSARMNAMHQANDAANDMVQELTLYYNKARQAAITSEIAEISAGANALAE